MKNIFTKKKIGLKDQIYFSKKLSFLLMVGIDIQKSLSLLTEHTKKPLHQELLTKAHNDISQGKSIHQSLQSIFPGQLGNHIVIAERTGSLAKSLETISKKLEVKQAFRRSLIGSLTYPLVIACMTIVISIFLVLYIFPKIEPLLTASHTPLPWTTQSLIFIHQHIVVISLSFASLCIIIGLSYIFILPRYPPFKQKFKTYYFRLPIIGHWLRIHKSSGFLSNASHMLEAGIPFDESLQLLHDTEINLQFGLILSRVRSEIRKGKRFSEALGEFPLFFSDEVIELCAIAEYAGTVPETCRYCSEMLDEDLALFIKRMSQLLEPLLMVFMGVIVGFIALSMMTPIYSLTQHIQR
jgi:type IV pilus assembly protein PilC